MSEWTCRMPVEPGWYRMRLDGQESVVSVVLVDVACGPMLFLGAVPHLLPEHAEWAPVVMGSRVMGV